MAAFRYALSSLRRNPGFAIAAIATLALGIGAATVMFTLVNAVALRPLPYRETSRLIWATEILKGNTNDQVTITADFLDWRRLNHSFDQLAAYLLVPRNLTGTNEPLHVMTARASADLLPALGVQPMRGRNFERAEDIKGQDGVAILSYGLWRRAFGGDTAIVGQSITLDGQARQVVGILPEEFVFPGYESVDILTPLGKDETAEMARSNGGVSIITNIIGRLKAGVSPAKAYADLAVIQASLPNNIGTLRYNVAIRVEPLTEHLLGDVQRAAWLLLGATLLLLLIACANTTNLLLTQAARREREMAIRAALGGSRRQLVTQLLMESSVMAALAAMGGLLIAMASRGPLLSIISKEIPTVRSLPIDASVLFSSIALAAAAALACGLIPAMRASGSISQRVAKARRGRLLSWIATGEVALSLVLLIGATLLIESFYRLRFGKLGFQPEHLMTATLLLDVRSASSLNGLLAAVQEIPGVESAAATDSSELPPGSGHMTNTFWIDRDPRPPRDRMPSARRQPLSEDYFRLMGIPLREGRMFEPRDRSGAPLVVLVNEALVRRVFPDGRPIGRRIYELGPQNPTEEIVGVVGDVKSSGLGTAPEPAIFYPIAQYPRPITSVALVLRTHLSPAAIVPELRRRVASVVPNQPITSIETMDQRLTESVARPRMVSALLTVFAGLALLLGLIGVYAVIGCCVRWRWRELAIRHALGAQQAHLRGLMLRQGGWIVAGGVTAGFAGAIAASRVLRSLLHETSATDLRTYVLAGAVLAIVGMFACWIPARRAATVDPAEVLRAE